MYVRMTTAQLVPMMVLMLLTYPAMAHLRWHTSNSLTSACTCTAHYHSTTYTSNAAAAAAAAGSANATASIPETQLLGQSTSAAAYVAGTASAAGAAAAADATLSSSIACPGGVASCVPYPAVSVSLDHAPPLAVLRSPALAPCLCVRTLPPTCVAMHAFT